MNSKKTHAFGSLEDRVESENALLDRISLREHVVEVEIGAFQVERGTTQRVSFDIVVEVSASDGPLADDVDRILSYDILVEAIAKELTAERLNLLETLAERIASRILRERQAARVFLRIQKLDLGPGALGIEIVRSNNSNVSSKQNENLEATPRHILVYFSSAAIKSKYLPGWLDQLQAFDKPIIICLEPLETVSFVTETPMVHKRVELLAIEQTAWVLAGLESRCLVVGSRAEIEWAARKNRLAIWAPSKIVLDTLVEPVAPAGDAVALALWFAQILKAEQLILVDAQIGVASIKPVLFVALDQAIF